MASTAAFVTSPYVYTFNSDGALQEAGTMNDSSSSYWWVNSGAYLKIASGIGATNRGSLSALDPWRVLYNSTSPIDTDNGYHPQNLFRLVSRSTWTNVAVESMFKIDADNFSSSSNRNASNGLLQMLRYQSGGDTLYYVGVRVDGYAVIKKKKNGVYTTLATKKIYPGTYSVPGKMNLLPHDSWVALRSEVVTNGDGTVTIREYLRNPGDSAFTKILEATDTSNPITQSGFVGIRTDFMDVEFDNFRAEKI